MQIVQHYRALITAGQLKDGDRIPSARTLVDEWGVAHATAAKVLTTLRAEGLVKTTSGGAGGTVVDVRGLGFAPRDRMLAVRRSGKIYPPGEHAKILSAQLVDAPAHVADAMGLSVGTPVIRRHRITYQGDVPVSRSISWLPGYLAQVAPDLLVDQRIRQGTTGYIEQQTGRTMARGTDQDWAALADSEIAAELGIPVGSAVSPGRNWIRDSDGEVIEFGEYVSVGSRIVTHEYDLS
jgi:DNA-binding GntR family transcriptional regulator